MCHAPRSSAMVYPRACGGTKVRKYSDNLLMGLSPRLRGNLQGLADDVGRSRSIPAPAGEP